jgi:signal transduction histidine kinase
MGGGGYILETGLRKEKLETIVRGWDVLKRNSQVMKDLVLDMLTYSRPREPELEPSDINQICKDIADLLREKAKENNVDILLDLESNIEAINLDPKGIYRCILNLVSNAVDACDQPAGVVVITTKRIEGSINVLVSDNGCGISKEDRENIFNVFFSTKGSKGTGLGLSVTEKIISEHGGEIKVKSEPGAGTTFTIKLPG